MIYMRNVFLVSVLMFLAVVAGGTTIIWYSQAASTKHAIEQAIARINEKQPYFPYDSIETYGFPSNVFVPLVRPHFKGRVDLLLKSLQEAAARNAATPATAAFQDMPQWNEDILLNGRITFGINAWS